MFKYVYSELDPWRAKCVMLHEGFLLLSWFVFVASHPRFLAKTLSRVPLVEFSPLLSALREDLSDILLSATMELLRKR